ncbi:MAG: hypothetical protein KDD99_02320 [Bacteroidetes bacterium]|nr:hypothetical protein [Bacteroidota bacterium]
MNIAPSFVKTVNGSTKSKVDPGYWDTVLNLYESGRYKDTVVGIIHYVDPELAEKTGSDDQSSFVIPHGSAVIHIDIKNDHLYVKAPFLSAANASKIPLLRQVAQINFSPLNLARIVLEKDQLAFTYNCPLDLCEPYKMYEVFREICLYADAYDDEFIKKFGAKWLQEPIIKPYEQEVKSQIWKQVQLYVKEAQDYISYFETKRSLGYCWDILNITLMKIEYYANPQGILRSEIEKQISFLQGESQLNDKVSRGKEFLVKLQNYEQQEFEEDLYEAQTFIPYKYRSTLENIRSNFEESYQTARKERDGGDHMGATLSMTYIFFKLFYFNNVPDEISHLVANAMVKASGKTWQQASDHLWGAMHKIMTEDIKARKGKKGKGFLRSLFKK